MCFYAPDFDSPLNWFKRCTMFALRPYQTHDLFEASASKDHKAIVCLGEFLEGSLVV
jgi:hypothetical protein